MRNYYRVGHCEDVCTYCGRLISWARMARGATTCSERCAQGEAYRELAKREIESSAPLLDLGVSAKEAGS